MHRRATPNTVFGLSLQTKGRREHLPGEVAHSFLGKEAINKLSRAVQAKQQELPDTPPKKFKKNEDSNKK